MNYHLAAIQSGEVTKTNVIGIRKALNANARRDRGLSVSSTAPNMSDDDCDDIIQALGKHSPRVVGPLHDSGLKLLQSKRYAKRLEPVRDVIDGLESFRLVDFRWHKPMECVPVYRACGAGRWFEFCNIPWQSGGDGPELHNSLTVENARRDDFRALPGLSDYIATALEDLQHSESDEACLHEREERDTGTIYSLPCVTYSRLKSDYEDFIGKAGNDFREWCDRFGPESFGANFHLTRSGHGAGYWDRGAGELGDRLTSLCDGYRGLELYLGDDGRTYA